MTNKHYQTQQKHFRYNYRLWHPNQKLSETKKQGQADRKIPWLCFYYQQETTIRSSATFFPMGKTNIFIIGVTLF